MMSTTGVLLNGNNSSVNQPLLGHVTNPSNSSFCTQSPQMLNRLLTQSSTGIMAGGSASSSSTKAVHVNGGGGGAGSQQQTPGYMNGGASTSNASSALVEKPNYIALFDYESATKDDMTIKKNDQLIVIDKSHPDWWLAKNLRTKETGYVPYNYITTIDDLQIKE